MSAISLAVCNLKMIPYKTFISLYINIPWQYVPFQFPSQVHVALPFTSTLHVPLFSQGLLVHGETTNKNWEMLLFNQNYNLKINELHSVFLWDIVLHSRDFHLCFSIHDNSETQLNQYTYSTKSFTFLTTEV